MIACGVLKHGTFSWFGYMWLETWRRVGASSVRTELSEMECMRPSTSHVKLGQTWASLGKNILMTGGGSYFDLVHLKEVLFVKYSVWLCLWLSTFFDIYN